MLTRLEIVLVVIGRLFASAMGVKNGPEAEIAEQDVTNLPVAKFSKPHCTYSVHRDDENGSRINTYVRHIAHFFPLPLPYGYYNLFGSCCRACSTSRNSLRSAQLQISSLAKNGVTGPPVDKC